MARKLRSTTARKPKLTEVNEAALEMGEFNSCLAHALMAGASKILDGFVAGNAWSDDATIRAANHLLRDAAHHRALAREAYAAGHGGK